MQDRIPTATVQGLFGSENIPLAKQLSSSELLAGGGEYFARFDAWPWANVGYVAEVGDSFPLPEPYIQYIRECIRRLGNWDARGVRRMSK
jgi:hypothetical protein